jgi:hypothetical protein
LSPVSNATEKEKEKEKEKINPPMSPPAGKPAFVLPAGVDPGTWADFEAHRREIRKPLTDLARRTNVKVLVGLPPKQQREVVDTSIANRWVGLFPPKTKTPTPKKDRETYL